jgi:prephenate dehydrogenase
MKRTIGIMGFGRFGQFMAAHLSPRFDVIAGSRSDHAAEAESLGVEWAPLQTAAEQDCVIVSVSISTLRDVLRSFAPSFSRGALVCDVSSVKVYPCSLLDAYVPGGAIAWAPIRSLAPTPPGRAWRDTPSPCVRLGDTTPGRLPPPSPTWDSR